jgi:hypothetical protein
VFDWSIVSDVDESLNAQRDEFCQVRIIKLRAQNYKKFRAIVEGLLWDFLKIFIVVSCILISSKSFIRQQMHYLLILENFNIYTKT